MMSGGSSITQMLNGTLGALETVIPMPITPEKPVLIKESIRQSDFGVLVGVTGDIHGRLILEGTANTFGVIGAKMFGMELSDGMLESFAGELGNMIAGNMCTQVSQKGLQIDITPPTVIVGQSKISGFKTGLQLPIRIESADDLDVILLLEER